MKILCIIALNSIVMAIFSASIFVGVIVADAIPGESIWEILIATAAAVGAFFLLFDMVKRPFAWLIVKRNVPEWSRSKEEEEAAKNRRP